MLKDKVYLNKVFLAAIAKLFIIQVFFLVLSIFLTGGGHGIYIQFPIFYSWLLMPISFVDISEMDIRSTMGQSLMFYSLMIPIIFFILSVFLLLAVWYKIVKKKLYIWLSIIIQLIGAIIVIIIHKIKTDSFLPFFLFPSSSIIGVIAIILIVVTFFFFWRIFFKLFRK